jgi:hypothetical protein
MLDHATVYVDPVFVFCPKGVIQEVSESPKRNVELFSATMDLDLTHIDIYRLVWRDVYCRASPGTAKPHVDTFSVGWQVFVLLFSRSFKFLGCSGWRIVWIKWGFKDR